MFLFHIAAFRMIIKYDYNFNVKITDFCVKLVYLKMHETTVFISDVSNNI